MFRAELAQRLLLAIAAAAGVIWLAVSLADRDALADARKTGGALLQAHASNAAREEALRRAISETRRANDLRPGDQAPLSLRLYLYSFAGRTRSALASGQELIRVEPRNRLGWLAVAQFDPRRAAQARARLRVLIREPGAF